MGPRMRRDCRYGRDRGSLRNRGGNVATKAGRREPVMCREATRQRRETYSHSMVPGGLLVMSSTTRLTSATSLVIRVEIRSSTS
ncbi:hypothetical protein BN000_04505 [Mycobacterium europaeum]|uniref:Uncharacterized protein n=1 Tax=Mycobacterium europaeum TaxID=761804 RepID=A0A0U1DQP9_9MYCO|nr:hypothetical protein BN000_04505 [Mycobacterium europaeum]